jgi:hypothetical protein
MANASEGGIMRLVKPGDFCPNKDCRDYQKLQDGQTRHNIIKASKTKKGVQRYECKTCGHSFTETFGTLFYRKRTPADEILETLALLAEGSRISSLTRAKGFKEDTILGWLREAAQHAGAVEEVLLKDFRIKRGQLDGLWAYVRHKGEKKDTPKRRRAASSSVRPCSTWIAVCESHAPSRRTKPRPAEASLKCSNGVGIPKAHPPQFLTAGVALTKR